MTAEDFSQPDHPTDGQLSLVQFEKADLLIACSDRLSQLLECQTPRFAQLANMVLQKICPPAIS